MHVKKLPVLLPESCMSPIITTGTVSREVYAPEQNPYTIAIATKPPFVVTNGQRYVMTAHRRDIGAVTVSTPYLSARIPEKTRPKPDPALAMETR